MSGLLDKNSTCCQEGSSLDGAGMCCPEGIVDACGACNGTGKVIDVEGSCCQSTIDATGVCCQVNAAPLHKIRAAFANSRRTLLTGVSLRTRL